MSVDVRHRRQGKHAKRSLIEFQTSHKAADDLLHRFSHICAILHQENTSSSIDYGDFNSMAKTGSGAFPSRRLMIGIVALVAIGLASMLGACLIFGETVRAQPPFGSQSLFAVTVQWLKLSAVTLFEKVSIFQLSVIGVAFTTMRLAFSGLSKVLEDEGRSKRGALVYSASVFIAFAIFVLVNDFWNVHFWEIPIGDHDTPLGDIPINPWWFIGAFGEVIFGGWLAIVWYGVITLRTKAEPSVKKVLGLTILFVLIFFFLFLESKQVLGDVFPLS